MPDHMMGPDIIYKCPARRTVYIIQVKFLKKISKQEAMNACDTTDPQMFYCNRKTGNVLKGFEERRNVVTEELRRLQTDGHYSIQQCLFIHTGGSKGVYTQGALLFTKEQAPHFFDLINGELWNFLDSLRSKFE
jgi:hypothetical protein